MRRPARGCLVLAVLAGACNVTDALEPAPGAVPEGPLPPAGVDHVSFLLMPYLEPEQTIQQVRPLIDYLSRAVGVRVEPRIAESHDDLVRMATRGGVDLVALSPLAYVTAVSRGAPLRILATPVERGSPTYLGYIVVRASDARYRRVSDLRGARFAYVSRTSASGYLFARALMREHGIDPDRDLGTTTMSGSHPAVLRAVLDGAVDAGAIGSSILDVAGQSMAAGHDLRVIGKTSRIPFDAYCVRQDLDDATALRIQRALLDVVKSARHQEQVAGPLAFSGWISGEDARYETVRHALLLERVGRRETRR